MAIAFDNSAQGGSAGASSVTYAHTCTGSNLVLIVFVKIFSTSDRVTGVTYNGVSMARIAFAQDAYNRWSYVYMLGNPATGSNNVVTSLSSSSGINVTSHSYTGCKTTGLPDVLGTTLITASSTVTTSLTTATDNSWLVGSYNDSRTYVAGSGTTQRQVAVFSDVLNSFDSNGAKSPIGTYSLEGTVPVSPVSSVNFILAIAPAAASATQIKSADGVTLANIKSADGVNN